jgi:hypothetical protein
MTGHGFGAIFTCAFDLFMRTYARRKSPYAEAAYGAPGQSEGLSARGGKLYGLGVVPMLGIKTSLSAGQSLREARGGGAGVSLKGELIACVKNKRTGVSENRIASFALIVFVVSVVFTARSHRVSRYITCYGLTQRICAHAAGTEVNAAEDAGIDDFRCGVREA